MAAENEKTIANLFREFHEKHKSALELSRSLNDDMNSLETSVLYRHHAVVKTAVVKTNVRKATMLKESEGVTNELLDQIEGRMVRALEKSNKSSKDKRGYYDERYEMFDLSQGVQGLCAINKMRKILLEEKLSQQHGQQIREQE